MKLVYIFFLLVAIKQLFRYIFIKVCKYKRDRANFNTKEGKIKIHKLNKKIEWMYKM